MSLDSTHSSKTDEHDSVLKAAAVVLGAAALAGVALAAGKGRAIEELAIDCRPDIYEAAATAGRDIGQTTAETAEARLRWCAPDVGNKLVARLLKNRSLPGVNELGKLNFFTSEDGALKLLPELRDSDCTPASLSTQRPWGPPFIVRQGNLGISPIAKLQCGLDPLSPLEIVANEISA